MDLLSEFREAILRAADRGSRYYDALRARDLSAQSTDALNPLGASTADGFDDAFATGYDSGTGLTVVPFQWGISVWGAGDQWTGS